MYLVQGSFDTLPSWANNACAVRINHAGLTKADKKKVGFAICKKITKYCTVHAVDPYHNQKQDMMIKSAANARRYLALKLKAQDPLPMVVMMMMMVSYLSMGWLLLVSGEVKLI